MSDVFFIDVSEPDATRRQRKISIIASVPGRYALTRQVDAQGNRREFSCRVVQISPDAMTLAAPHNGAIGERVIGRCTPFLANQAATGAKPCRHTSMGKVPVQRCAFASRRRLNNCN